MPTIRSIEAHHKSAISLLWQPLDGMPATGYNAERQVKTASVIKLPILVHVALLVESGALSWEQRLPLSDSDHTPGAGVLKLMNAGLQPSLRDLAVLMMVISDNTATNMLIDLLGIDAINQRIQSLGLSQTRLNRKVFAPNTPDCLPWGLGVTSPRDIVQLLTAIVRGEIGNSTTNQFIRETLAGLQDRAGLPRGLPRNWLYAGKTGSDDDLRNDCGIITRPDGSHIVVACFVQSLDEAPSTADHPGLVALGQVAKVMA
jgi:beta-lactamase class A